MAHQNRTTLKRYFQRGSLPSQEHFEDLIDSTLNIIDEGFDKTAPDGLKIVQLSNAGKLISFFDNNASLQQALWSIRLDATRRQLIFEAQAPATATAPEAGHVTAPVLSLSAAGRLGVNQPEPAYTLDVDGFVASRGRIGSVRGTVPADGTWHPITEELTGCHAFEIMAGAGGRTRQGKYALLHAVALNTFAASGLFRRRHAITNQQAYYGSRCNRLKLRWRRRNKSTHTYQLELRTMCGYGDDTSVTFYLTDLWPGTLMQQTNPPDGRDTSSR